MATTGLLAVVAASARPVRVGPMFTGHSGLCCRPSVGCLRNVTTFKKKMFSEGLLCDNLCLRSVKQAREQIARRAQALGIPSAFAPSLHVSWCSRGQNGTREQGNELTRVAYTKIEQLQKELVQKGQNLRLHA